MSGIRKLLTVAAMTAVLFVAAFGTSFFTLQLAFADHHGDHAEKGEHVPKPGTVVEKDPTTHFNFWGPPNEHYGKDATGGKYGDGKMTDGSGDVIVDEHGHAAEHEMSAPFIFMVLNFVLLLILLAWKGKPAIEKLAADRHDQIKTALDEAAKLRKQAADKLEEYASKLAKADAEIKSMVDGMRADAEADKKRILEAAERQAAQMRRDAELRIAAEIELARTALTREVTQAATAAAEQMLREKVTAGDQQQIVDVFIAGVQTSAHAGARVPGAQPGEEAR